MLDCGCGRAFEPAAATTAESGAVVQSTRYEDLIALFSEWRTFQRPTPVNGVPDYTPVAMAAQQKALAVIADAWAPSIRAAGRSHNKWTTTSSARR
jgi:hypothetical protein